MINGPPRIYLKAGREKPVLRLHPWIFSGSVEKVDGQPAPGQTVEVFSHDHQWLARAAYSNQSKIRARIWTWDRDQVIDRDFFLAKLANASAKRESLIGLDETDAFRLVHAESDGLPGLIVDRYANWGVIQLLAAGPERWRDTLISCLQELGWFPNLLERSDAEVRRLEGLQERVGVLFGRASYSGVPIRESGIRYQLDLGRGQKTGFYLDQRENRRLVAGRARETIALDAFCYNGGFTMAMLAGGARRVTAIDSSPSALEELKENIKLNKFDPAVVELREADVFHELRVLRDEGRQFDLIVLDPPKFAPTRQNVEGAARGYKDINLNAINLLRPGGELFTFSCSGGVDPDLFHKIVAGAAVDAGRHATIHRWLDQGPDHPVSLAFPEGRYLKGLHCIIA